MAKRYTNLSLLEVGDKIFEDSEYGPCSGGARYGLFETVTKITKDKIFAKTGSGESSIYDKKGYCIKFPVYKIQWFEKP